MGTFAGFSDEDIRKLQAPETKVLKGMSQKKKVTFGSPKIITNTTRNKIALNTKLATCDIPEEAKLSKTTKKEITEHDPISCNSLEKETLEEENVLQSKESNSEINVSQNSGESNASPTLPSLNSDLVKKRLESTGSKLIDLKEFEIRQKAIEEQNKRRKELLSQALAARTKRTQEEAKKLEEIQVEFKKLDGDLSNDVKILRQQIDIASMEYMEVQKRYLKIEREFLDVKLQLHQKLERKDLLTEHLCTIIERNEERKATKLMDLLSKLHLDDGNAVNINEQITNTV